MLLREIIDVYGLLDRADASGAMVLEYMRGIRPDCRAAVSRLQGAAGGTDMIKITVPGRCGRANGGSAPTIGLLGRLGGLGARPERLGFVSDGDGALVVLACAAKLLDMQNKGDFLEGDVFIATHICPDAPTQPHEPVPFMGSPVAMEQLNREEVGAALDGILVADTTKGNRIINARGFAISPTVKQGYILRVSEDLLDLMQITTGRLPQVFALSQQDITPYGNGLYHLNSILQPATATDAPVVGVAITTEAAVPGCATGTCHYDDCEAAARFMLETAKAFTRGACALYDQAEFALLQKLYGGMERFQTPGVK